MSPWLAAIPIPNPIPNPTLTLEVWLWRPLAMVGRLHIQLVLLLSEWLSAVLVDSLSLPRQLGSSNGVEQR